VVRLKAEYEAFGRPSSMVFHARTHLGAIPIDQDCKRAIQAYGLWEDSGFGFGYTLVRHQDSVFRRCNAWSLDRRSQASFIDTPFSRPGQLGRLEGYHMVATDLAPLIRWYHGDRQPHGRTYAVGVAQNELDVDDDRQVLGEVEAGDVATIFRRLAPMLQTYAGLVLVSLRTRIGGVALAVPDVLDITTGDMPTRLMATQRRRTRHGRG
jgi:hypothetical protein